MRVYISKLILEFPHIVYEIAENDLTNFHIQERYLYKPLGKKLITYLPSKELIEYENLLYKNTRDRQATDLSIRRIYDLKKNKKDKSIDYSHFLEIKKLFHGDKITAEDIDDDLEKLRECTIKYNAIGFFILIGLKEDIEKNNNAFSNLGMTDNQESFSVTTYNSKEIWLKPSGTNELETLKIFLWEISSKNNFKSHRTDFNYTMFQNNS